MNYTGTAFKKSTKMPNFNPQGIIDTAAGTIFGLALQGHNDQRQIDQQKRLQAMQIEGQKNMIDYSMAAQFDMWNKTNYEAQVEHLKKAGLNPALLYGKGGAGGTTTGQASGSVQGANAPAGGREIMEMGQMMLQKSMMEAQIKLAEAQANKTNVEANKIGGVDTQATVAQTQLLAQELDNRREDYNIKRLQQTMMNIENYEKQATQENRLEYIEITTETAMKQLKLIANQGTISDATVQEQIQIIQRQAIGAALQNELTRTQTKGIHSSIQVNNQQINNFIQQNMREWDKMSQVNKEIAVKQLLGEYNTDPVNDAVRNISGIIDNIFFISPKVTQQRTVVEGFKRY